MKIIKLLDEDFEFLKEWMTFVRDTFELGKEEFKEEYEITKRIVSKFK
jgi:hypothetical protein